VGTEIWTLLEPRGPRRTAVEVRFYLPEHRPDRLAALGEKYRASYARLWDQDEAMMMRREALLARPRRPSERSRASLALGPLSELRPRLPLLLELDGEPFRIIELADGALVAHSTICPHWLGPLEEAVPENGIVRCPWHGYRFDLKTGASADGTQLSTAAGAARRGRSGNRRGDGASLWARSGPDRIFGEEERRLTGRE
jgi:nitrite reductase/ring-hydroxylating ferredoxin subunit